ncbi:MAG: CHAT domain-containing protein, partial [Planctomycetota bacterium]
LRVDRPRAALRHYTRIDRLLSAESPPRLRAVLAANRANALEARHRFRAAARHFALARKLFQAEGCDHTVAQVDYNAAYAEALRGRYESALQRYAEVEGAFGRLRDERHLALIDLERAEIYVHLNMPEEAGASAARAGGRFDTLGMGKERAQAVQLAGRAAELRCDPDEAERCLLRAQEMFASLGLAERRLSCLVQRGFLAARLGRQVRARRLAEKAASLLAGDAGPLAAASVELLRARLELLEGNPTGALHRADSVRMGCRRLHAPWVQIEAHRLIGQASAARRQLDEAVLAYKHAIDELERYRGGVPPDEYMAAFLAGRSELYAEIIDLLVRGGHSQLAFEFTERAKSRALVDLLAGRPRGGAADAAGSLTERRLRHLRERLNTVYQRLFQQTAGVETRSARAVQQARRRAGELEEEMGQVLRRARLVDREGASLEAVEAPDLAAVRRDLEPDTALIEFFVTERELFTFVVTPRDLHVVRRDAPEKELRRRIERFRFHLSQFDRPDSGREQLTLEATRANLARLADLLLGPAAERLEVRRLIVAPHGVLHHLPFHALPWGDGWVADRFEVVYTPSAAVYGYCRRRRPRRSGPACVFGVPDEAAPEIEREVRRVAQVLQSDDVHLGEEATLARLREAARTARILHVATHGMFRREQPLLSSIRLADTWLNLYDLYSLELDADLVVLSACESGVADVTGGDEILGLTRGFLYAGARALLASQWRVDDASTAELMESVYHNLEETGDAAAA